MLVRCISCKRLVDIDFKKMGNTCPTPYCDGKVFLKLPETKPRKIKAR